ncbi:hydrophobic surface binding protein A-domain-containing protein [Microdochium trichocladiopsis]|uniref:Hydrophobic surface binding protein A-domain-containing protein n=1 Tax=Microdochium trichocladiopsis TaxID=1682393 RepID=A0A9P8XSN8_9PEZI|nr:hydrophobic surface binding protein A-domain-containing protein [Microdochium trichocladiopsis]KAH7014500.1 hydrophobic surface binding protein A-domain-containing protein [Microdochium trichocladiopsis]
MLFKNVFVAATALFGFAAASPVGVAEKSVLPRQASAIKTALLAAQAQTITLRDTFAAATGTDPNEVTTLRAQSASLLNSINAATAVVQASPALTLLDVLGFASTVSSLQQTLDSTLDVVVSKKPQVDSLGLTAEVHQTLLDQKAAIDNFGVVLLTKVPTAAKSIAQGYINNFDASFNTAIAAYA